MDHLWCHPQQKWILTRWHTRVDQSLLHLPQQGSVVTELQSFLEDSCVIWLWVSEAVFPQHSLIHELFWRTQHVWLKQGSCNINKRKNFFQDTFSKISLLCVCLDREEFPRITFLLRVPLVQWSCSSEDSSHSYTHASLGRSASRYHWIAAQRFIPRKACSLIPPHLHVHSPLKQWSSKWGFMQSASTWSFCRTHCAPSLMKEILVGSAGCGPHNWRTLCHAVNGCRGI